MPSERACPASSRASASSRACRRRATPPARRGAARGPVRDAERRHEVPVVVRLVHQAARPRHGAREQPPPQVPRGSPSAPGCRHAGPRAPSASEFGSSTAVSARDVADGVGVLRRCARQRRRAARAGDRRRPRRRPARSTTARPRSAARPRPAGRVPRWRRMSATAGSAITASPSQFGEKTRTVMCRLAGRARRREPPAETCPDRRRRARRRRASGGASTARARGAGAPASRARRCSAA